MSDETPPTAPREPDDRGPMRGFVVVREFGARVGSDFRENAFGGQGRSAPGPIRRFLALLLLVLLIVPVIVLFVLIALVALAVGIVVSLLNVILRPFRPVRTQPRSWVRDSTAEDHEHDPDGPSGPIGRDDEGRENVRVARRG